MIRLSSSDPKDSSAGQNRGNLQSVARVAALAAGINAATFVFGFVLYFGALAPYVDDSGDSGDTASVIAFLAAHRGLVLIWNSVIYLVFGVGMVVLTLALHELIARRPSLLARVTNAFGLIWAALVIAAGMIANVAMHTVIDVADTDTAQAESLWLAMRTLQNGLGGGNELVGSLWMILLSLAALRVASWSRALNYLGLLVGAVGLMTVLPWLQPLGAIFGLGSIVWFIGLGVVLWRARSAPVSSN